VHDYYLQFLSGSLKIVDAETGELFNRDSFRDKNGNYIIISQATVWNVLNKPDNALVVDRLRKAALTILQGQHHSIVVTSRNTA
jgi:hypothetical protein